MSRRPQCVGYERVRWIQLVHGNDDNKEKFQAQIRALRAISDACKLQLSLPPSQLCLPNAIYLRRRQPERVSVPILTLARVSHY